MIANQETVGMQTSDNRSKAKLIRENVSAVKALYPSVTRLQLLALRELTRSLQLSVCIGDVIILEGKWYVTHSGLLRIAHRRRCKGIRTELSHDVSSPKDSRWIFRATVLKSKSLSFVAYGDADPSNVSPSMRGAEMRVAETRAVNRALRKAYGIGICSIEELGSFDKQPRSDPEFKNGNGNFGARTVRDRLCQLIRQHQLDANLVKSYATEFCGVKALRDAPREQVEKFVTHLAEEAEKDRSALVRQLSSYGNSEAGAA